MACRPEAGSPAPPDHMVFDLDPGTGTSIVECCIVGRHIADLLDDSERVCLPKTSGSKGLQIYVPLSGRRTWETVRARRSLWPPSSSANIRT